MFIPVVMSQFEFITISPATVINISMILRDGVETVPKCVKTVFFVVICVKDSNPSSSIITLILGSIDTLSDKWLNAKIINEIGGIKKVLRISDINTPILPIIKEENTIVPEEQITTIIDEDEDEDEEVDIEECETDPEEYITTAPIIEEENLFLDVCDISNDSISSLEHRSTNILHIPSHKMIFLYIPKIDPSTNPNGFFQLHLFQNTWVRTIQNMISEYMEHSGGQMSEDLLKNIFFSMCCFNRESVTSQQIFIHLIFRALLPHHSEKVYDMILWVYKNIIYQWVDNIYRLKFLIGDRDRDHSQEEVTKIDKEISFHSSSGEDEIDEGDNIESKQDDLIHLIITPRLRGLYDKMMMMNQLDNNSCEKKENYFSSYFKSLLQQWNE
jgi:hypothetical protein